MGLKARISKGWGYCSDMTQKDPVYDAGSNPDGEWDGPYGENMLEGEVSLTQYFTGPQRDIYVLEGKADSDTLDEYVYYILDLSSLHFPLQLSSSYPWFVYAES